MACTVVEAMPVLRQEYTAKLPHEVVGAPSDSGRYLVRRRGWTTKRVAGDTITMRSFLHHPLWSAGLTALFFVALLLATPLRATLLARLVPERREGAGGGEVEGGRWGSSGSSQCCSGLCDLMRAQARFPPDGNGMPCMPQLADLQP